MVSKFRLITFSATVVWYVCDVFNDATSNSNRVASNDSMAKWVVSWKGYERKRSWRNISYYPSICLAGLRMTMKNLRQDTVSGRRFILGISRIRSSSLNHLAATLINIFVPLIGCITLYHGLYYYIKVNALGRTVYQMDGDEMYF
jgi:hypothetical protein